MTPDRWAEVERLYHAALTRALSDRAAFLREVCPGDEALRQEVEALLAQSATGDFLAAPAIAVAADLVSTPGVFALMGRRIGVYEIHALLGVGGMGEVYRARDTKLGRDVAIKILPRAITSEPERLARFEREARMLAALNHPNIGSIYGFEEADGIRALVLELVDGETLADRIARGPLALDDALPIARQIAEALEAAHEKGIIHRDLKPANIKVRPDRMVKVLDFGLAKAMDPTGATSLNQSLSPTITTPAITAAGWILGTASYMSPEQATGKPVDKRADVWSFGAVLFEMLTGRRLFDGETVTHTLADILRAPIDLSRLPSDTPVAVRGLLARCLEREPKSRLRDIGEVRIVLSRDFEQAHPPTVRAERPQWMVHTAWVGVALVAAVAGWYVSKLAQPVAPDVSSVRFSIAQPAGASWALGGGAVTADAMSPDGRRLAIVINVGGRNQIAVHILETEQTHILADTDGARAPFWSPDSRFIGFFSLGKLKKVDADAGAPQVLCDAPQGEGGSWNADDTIVFAAGPSVGLSRVSADGGAVSAVSQLDPEKKEQSHRHPWFMPDGRHFLFVSLPSTIYVGSLDGPTRTEVTSADSKAQFAAGHLLFARGGALFAQPFDPRRSTLTGEARRVAERIAGRVNSGEAAFTVSTNGVLALRQRVAGVEQSQLVWVDRTGRELSRLGEREDQTGIEISPDGHHVAASILDGARGTRDIWLYDVVKHTRARLTFDTADDFNPIWSPDGLRITWTSSRKGRLDFYQKLASGAGAEELLLSDDFDKFPWTHTRDGLISYWSAGSATGEPGLSVVSTRDRKPMPFATEERTAGYGHLSPDGRWLLYRGVQRIGTQPAVRRPLSRLGREVASVARWPTRTLEGRREGDLLLVEQQPADVSRGVRRQGNLHRRSHSRLVRGASTLDGVWALRQLQLRRDGRRAAVPGERGRRHRWGPVADDHHKLARSVESMTLRKRS